VILIPFQPGIASYQLAVNILATEYILDVRWNERDSAWFFDLLDENSNQIVSGNKIILGGLLAKTASDKGPRGVFIAKDTSGNGQEAGLDDLGTRVIVRFYTPEEILAL
jgi:hypothetical protein